MVKTSNRITLTNDNKIKLSIDGYDNVININGVDYELRYLNEIQGNKGGNSNIFKIQVVGEDDDEDEPLQYIIKISKNATNIAHTYFNQSRIQRFRREIAALKKANSKKLSNVVKIIDNDLISVGGREFPFYTMEMASSDLTNYLVTRRTIQQKILLFQSILEGIKQLHSISIYHRDIKHDNIFMFNTECKIGDLGLMRYRDEDNLAIDRGQRIGAFGWETPEAMNKFLTENHPNPEFIFDCEIDESSDIFQLGKLFWYILQGNLPIGSIDVEDFRIDDPELFDIVLLLLQHGKENTKKRRPLNITTVQTLIDPIAKKYGVA